jgi:hypothetical protein
MALLEFDYRTCECIIKPSHPRYFQELQEFAAKERPIGLQVGVVEEVVHWVPPRAPKKSSFKRLKNWLNRHLKNWLGVSPSTKD